MQKTAILNLLAEQILDAVDDFKHLFPGKQGTSSYSCLLLLQLRGDLLGGI